MSQSSSALRACIIAAHSCVRVRLRPASSVRVSSAITTFRSGALSVTRFDANGAREQSTNDAADAVAITLGNRTDLLFESGRDAEADDLEFGHAEDSTVTTPGQGGARCKPL